MAKPILLYELDALARDDLSRVVDELADAVERPEDSVRTAIEGSRERYERGEITQIAHWGQIALKLALDDTEIIGAFALNSAEFDSELLGRIRAQSPVMTLGLISDATPDWVAHYRKTYQLDELLHVHVIGSELDEERDYPGLLKLSAERLQAAPGDVRFIDWKPAHLQTAQQVGLQTIDLAASPDYATAFKGL
jgi:putative hydrolase of the HAD superfamily